MTRRAWPYRVEQQGGVFRVFTGSVAIFHGSEQDAYAYVSRKRDEYALTVRCPLCLSRPGTRCYNQQGVMAVPHMARHGERDRLDEMGRGQS